MSGRPLSPTPPRCMPGRVSSSDCTRRAQARTTCRFVCRWLAYRIVAGLAAIGASILHAAGTNATRPGHAHRDKAAAKEPNDSGEQERGTGFRSRRRRRLWFPIGARAPGHPRYPARRIGSVVTPQELWVEGGLSCLSVRPSVCTVACMQARIRTPRYIPTLTQSSCGSAMPGPGTCDPVRLRQAESELVE